MGFLKKLFKKEEVKTGNFISIHINDKIMPVDRFHVYGDPLDQFVQEQKIGEVTGGGTAQAESGELQSCDLELRIDLEELSEAHTNSIIELLEKAGAPKGSSINLSNNKISFGKREGIAVYLDGVNLPDKTYETCDTNVVFAALKHFTQDNDETLRSWQGNTETGLYFYGESFETMNAAIQNYVSKYPLCEGARIVQIA